MPIKRYMPEQVVTLLLRIEVEIANGKTTPLDVLCASLSGKKIGRCVGQGGTDP